MLFYGPQGTCGLRASIAYLWITDRQTDRLNPIFLVLYVDYISLKIISCSQFSYEQSLC